MRISPWVLAGPWIARVLPALLLWMNESVCIFSQQPACWDSDCWQNAIMVHERAFTPAPRHKNGDSLARDDLLDLEHGQSSFPSGHRKPLSGSIRSDDVVLGQAFPPAQLSLPLSPNAPQHTMPNYIWYTHHIHTRAHMQTHTHTHEHKHTRTHAHKHTPRTYFIREGRKSRTCYISSSQNKTTTASTGMSMKHWYLGTNHIG